MVYIDLPPEENTAAEPAAPSRKGRPSLSHKRQWRRDNLIKQLVDPTVVAETPGLLERQAADIYEAFKPRNGWQDWLTTTIATIILRINRSERIERKLRDMASLRAIDFWEDDQKLEVETVALRIGKQPAKVISTLRNTPAGIDWLIVRWQILSRIKPEDWNDAQRELAANLVAGETEVDPSRAGFADAQIDELQVHRERIAQADAITRGLVEADLNDDGVGGLAKLRRYLRSLHRQLKWYVDQFHVEHPDRWDDPMRRPAIYGPQVEKYRPRNPDRFEGETSPRSDETKPTPVAEVVLENDETKPLIAEITHEIDETKPLIAEIAHEIDETKPFEATAEATPSAIPVKIEPPVFIHDYSNEKGRNHSRALKAGEHSREYARRQKAARRKTNLALAEIT